MANILSFPRPYIKIPKGFPRQQLFFIGNIFSGPLYNRSITHCYLKRNKVYNDVRTWSLKIFGKQTDNDQETFFDIDICYEHELLEMLEKWKLFDQVTYKKLRRMGWKGEVKTKGQIIDLFIYKKKSNL